MNPDPGHRAALPAAEVWREMRLHMEWNDRLSLVFLFADGAAALKPIRQWADDAWQWRTAPMKVLVPEHAEQAVPALFDALASHAQAMGEVRAPMWVEMLAETGDGEPWDDARTACLARLNEAREWLSRSFARPLVLCLPTRWLREVGHLAPDLWHVRSFVAAVAADRPPEASPMAAQGLPLSGPADESQADIERLSSEAAQRRQAAAEAARKAPSTARLREHWWWANKHAALLLAAGRVDEASAAANEALALARALCESAGERPEALRDLSLSLNQVGDAEHDAGRGEAALSAYRESLALRRQLRTALGDSPQVLRDLSVSLEKVGDAERDAGRGEAALSAYRESLALRRQLRTALGDSPQVLRDLSVSLNKVGDAERDAGRGEAALSAHRESLALRRQLRTALGDSPLVLRDLSVSLNQVGDAERDAGRGEAALSAYRESLALSRQLRTALGDTPQVLDDLACGLERVALAPTLSIAERRAAIDEAIALRQVLLGALSGSPHSAERLSTARKIAERLADNPVSALPQT